MLQDLLPAEVHAAVKLDRTGHVAELRLHPEHLPFRDAIAQVTESFLLHKEVSIQLLLWTSCQIDGHDFSSP